jgi:hypothetical protein
VKRAMQKNLAHSNPKTTATRASCVAVSPAGAMIGRAKLKPASGNRCAGCRRAVPLACTLEMQTANAEPDPRLCVCATFRLESAFLQWKAQKRGAASLAEKQGLKIPTTVDDTYDFNRCPRVAHAIENDNGPNWNRAKLWADFRPPAPAIREEG